MNFLKKLLSPKTSISTTNPASFWQWFQSNHQAFFATVKSRKNIDSHFLSKLTPKLQQLNSQFFPLTGMLDENTAELIVTADGDIKSFIFVEDLITAAPEIPGWKFTALKPESASNTISINMAGNEFNSTNIHFTSPQNPDYPDEINLHLIHDDFNNGDQKTISNGSLIYLDNILGELQAATLIDSVKVEGRSQDQEELIPIPKLKDFLVWREKEFVEKYKDGLFQNTSEDTHSLMESRDKNGLAILAVVNTELLKWDSKASYPWMLVIDINYPPESNGMPDDTTFNAMTTFEDNLMPLLPDTQGYLNLGREIYNGTRSIYFACKEFRNSSKIAKSFIDSNKNDLEVTYNIYRDKYWITMRNYM